MRESFRKHIQNLEARVVTMGQRVEEAIRESITALKERDMKAARQIVKDDEIINRQRWEIEESCVNLIALQQPVASDLREMIAIMNIVTDLERMGDHAEGIAKIVLLLGDNVPAKPFAHILVMAEKAIQMLSRSIDAFVRRDAKAAEAICKMDDQVDELNDKVYHELIQLMISQPALVTSVTYQIWAAHNLERIADRVTNICERIVYLVTGSIDKLPETSKY